MAEEKFSNFLTDIIDADLAEGKVDVGAYPFPAGTERLPAHWFSAKAIFINYTIAKHYGGLFNLRFDDTNPAREGDEYVAEPSRRTCTGWVPTPTAASTTAAIILSSCYEYAEQLIQRGQGLRGRPDPRADAGVPRQRLTGKPGQSQPVP